MFQLMRTNESLKYFIFDILTDLIEKYVFQALRTQRSHEDPKTTELLKRTHFLFNSL